MAKGPEVLNAWEDILRARNPLAGQNVVHTVAWVKERAGQGRFGCKRKAERKNKRSNKRKQSDLHCMHELHDFSPFLRRPRHSMTAE
jgi:hypothetical protein